MSASAACYVCARDPTKHFCEVLDYNYFRCEVCEHAGLLPIPNRSESARVYEEGYFSGSVVGGYADYLGDSSVHHRNACARCRRLLTMGARPPGRLLDVGCAAGFFLDEARRSGWDVAGVDVSEWARRQAGDRFGLEVLDSLEAAAEHWRGSFDTVTLFQVLEHMPDPRSALQLVRTQLKPGGLLVIETWDRMSLVARLSGRYWQQISPPSVIHLFSRSSLDRLLKSEGFTIQSVRRTAKFVSFSFASSLLAKKHPRTLGFLGWLARRRGIRGIVLPYALDDLITVSAQSAVAGREAGISGGPKNHSEVIQ